MWPEDVHVMAYNDRQKARALSFFSGQLIGSLENSRSDLDRETLEYVVTLFNESLDACDIDSKVLHIDPDEHGGD